MAKKKATRFKKGSAAARAFMAKLRSMQGGKRKRRTPVKKSAGWKTLRQKRNTKWSEQAVTRSESSAEKALNTLRNKGRHIAKSAGIKPFFFTGRKPQIVVSEGEFGMARKRRTSKRRAAKSYSGRTRKYHGLVTSRRRARRSNRLLGGNVGKDIPALLIQGVAGAAGAVGSAFIAKKIPGVPAKMKPAIPIAVAIALLMFGKKIPMSKPIAFGCAMSGVLGMVKQFVPALPTLAGVDSAPELSGEELSMLGGPQTFGAVSEFSGAMSPADI